MLRYLKVRDVWVDTLEAQKKGLTYMVIDGVVIVMDEKGIETVIGHLQEEKDI